MDIVYLVKGYLTPTSEEKIVFYNGQSAKKAFGFLDKYSEKAEIEIELYEDGTLIQRFDQQLLIEFKLKSGSRG